MNPEQIDLVERLRSLLASEPTTREVSMFGGRSFMVNDKMVAAARKDGGLLVRIAAECHNRLLNEPGAMQAQMGPGRDMGPGWIEIAASVLGDDDVLAHWVTVALDHNRATAGGR